MTPKSCGSNTGGLDDELHVGVGVGHLVKVAVQQLLKFFRDGVVLGRRWTEQGGRQRQVGLAPDHRVLNKVLQKMELRSNLQLKRPMKV